MLIIIGAGWYLLSSSPSVVDNNELTPLNTNEQSDFSPMLGEDQTLPLEEESSTGTVAVALTSSGFVPKTITVPKGAVVVWLNEGSGSMWVASAMHPTHEVYGETTRSEHCAASYTGAAPFDQCENSSRFAFTFDQSGTWQYHNHLDGAQTGTVIVE
jgi:plastocyanin